MLDQLWTFVLNQLQNNQFLAGGAVLAILATVAHQCREIPRRVWWKIKSQFIIEVDIPDRDEAFIWVNQWLSKHPYGQKRARLLTVKTERPGEDCDDLASDRNTQPQIIFSPSVGCHWFFYKRRLVILVRDRRDGSEQGGGGGGGGISLGIKETFTLKVFTRRRAIVQQLLEEARELVHPRGERRVAILAASRYCADWSTKAKRRPRTIESVILRPGVFEELIPACKKFLSGEQWYLDRGIPWRMGVLLKGPPGSGKSSAVIALASHFGLDIAILSLTESTQSDDNLRDLLASVPKNTIVLIEDIDCVFDERTSSDKKGSITFSGLLNAIDGVAAGEGRILFMTTNHPEKLDPALIRPGRADLRIDIGWPDAGQISRMYGRFFPDATNEQNLRFVEAVPKSHVSMAGLQTLLTKYAHDAEQAIAHAHEAAIHAEKAVAQQ
jgi:chaperone BCS1